MIFKNIKIENFMAIESAEVPLNNMGFVTIQGVNLTDSSDSCGSGKTTIVNALNYCLTGETTKGVKDVQNRYTDGDCSVTVEFESGKDYSITRTKGKSLTIKEDGIDISGKGIRDTQELIEKMFPSFTTTYLGATAIIAQKLVNCFADNTGAKRKEILETLTNSDYQIEDIKKRLDKLKAEVQQDTRKAEDEKLRDETIHDNALRVKEMSEDELAKYPTDVEIKRNIESSGKSIQEIEEKLLELKTKQEQSYTQGIAQSQELEKATTEQQEKVKAKTDENNQKIKAIEKELSELKHGKAIKEMEIRKLETEIRKIESDSGVCPTCKQVIKGHTKIDTTPMQREIAELKKEINEQSIKDTETRLSKAESTARTEINALAENDTIEQMRAELSRLRSLYKEATSAIKETQDKLNTEKESLERLRERLSVHKFKLEEIKTRIAQSDTTIKQTETNIENRVKQLDRLKSRQDIINKYYSFATREFRTILLADTIQLMENRAKELSKQIFGTDKINFKQDGAGIFIGYNDKPLESLSGGEETAVKLMIQLALRDVLEMLTGENCNLIFLDEVFDGLDKAWSDAVVEMISRLNVESVFIITHHQELQLPSDRTITVTKKDNIAEVQV